MRQGLIVFVVAVVVTGAFLINLCATVYRCGCQSWWGESDKHCSIHQPVAKRCPWCTHGGIGFVAAFLSILGVQAWACFGRRGWPWFRKLAVSLAAFPVVGGLVAVVVGFLQGYWD